MAPPDVQGHSTCSTLAEDIGETGSGDDQGAGEKRSLIRISTSLGTVATIHHLPTMVPLRALHFRPGFPCLSLPPTHSTVAKHLERQDHDPQPEWNQQGQPEAGYLLSGERTSIVTLTLKARFA